MEVFTFYNLNHPIAELAKKREDLENQRIELEKLEKLHQSQKPEVFTDKTPCSGSGDSSSKTNSKKSAHSFVADYEEEHQRALENQKLISSAEKIGEDTQSEKLKQSSQFSQGLLEVTVLKNFLAKNFARYRYKFY